MKLFKTEIIIWSEYDPRNEDTNGLEANLQDLAFEAKQGAAHCSKVRVFSVSHPELDPDWDGITFSGFDY